MTIVELFDSKPINNIVGLLSFNPDKVIYVGGESSKHFEGKELPVLRRYLEKKALSSIEIEYVHVKRNSLKDIIDKLENIYQNNDVCKFHVEVTGGEDLILVGLGALFEKHPDLELYRISSKLKNMYSFSRENCDGNKLDISCSNSVEENLMLHGASIVYANGSDAVTGGFDYSVDFISDFNRMWEIMCKGLNVGQSAPNCWNRVIYALTVLVREYAVRLDWNSYEINQFGLNEILKNSFDSKLFETYISVFAKYGWLSWNQRENGAVVVFKDKQIETCLTKSGLVLEMKVYLTCKELFEERGGDCLTGVTIDWDGDDDIVPKHKYLLDPDDLDSSIDTLNEIDVVANLGLVPYFISCKNGVITSSELYKLDSLGYRFGREYAKVFIVTTDISYALDNKLNLFRQRALDMEIELIENVHLLNDDEFKEELRKRLDLQKVKR